MFFPDFLFPGFMAKKDYIIAGLGNPGAQYETTRHNVGFMLLDRLAHQYDLTFSSCKWDALMVRSTLWGCRVFLIKPETYMNRSGLAIAGVANFFNIPVDHILVVHDDIDMHPGRIKLVAGGGAGGHKGIKSLIQHLGTTDFHRLKIGIGRPGNSDSHPDMPVDKFVLSRFSAEEAQLIQERLGLLDEGIKALVNDDAKRAMNMLNSIK